MTKISSRLWSVIGLVLSAVFLVSACTSERNTAECAELAEVQAHAESAWGEALQAHNAAHTEGHAHGSHDELVALRAGVIIAEAEVRRVCG
ncbi:MAG: hypothetical protein OXB92_04560 [Acidimicrobiaceae bacterium]|nr:hypothetical protein [Acidimicrobiia bacterium]MCY4493114.1 hypothetical protein [Acidimicrobiaceae bacterium]